MEIDYKAEVLAVYPDAECLLVEYENDNLWCITTPKKMLSYGNKTPESAWQSAFNNLKNK